MRRSAHCSLAHPLLTVSLHSRQMTHDPPFSDFKIVCGSTEFNVHRVIISAHSKNFDRLCTGPFIESEKRQVVLHDDSDTTILALVQYCYSFDFNTSSASPKAAMHGLSEPWEGGARLRHLSAVFTAADKFAVFGLKDLAHDKFKAAMRPFTPGGVSRAVELLPPALLDAIQHVWQEGPPSDDRLRKHILQRLLQDEKQVLASCNRMAFDKVMQDVPQFACDLFHATSGVTMMMSSEKSD